MALKIFTLAPRAGRTAVEAWARSRGTKAPLLKKKNTKSPGNVSHSCCFCTPQESPSSLRTQQWRANEGGGRGEGEGRERGREGEGERALHGGGREREQSMGKEKGRKCVERNRMKGNLRKEQTLNQERGGREMGRGMVRETDYCDELCMESETLSCPHSVRFCIFFPRWLPKRESKLGSLGCSPPPLSPGVRHAQMGAGRAAQCRRAFAILKHNNTGLLLWLSLWDPRRGGKGTKRTMHLCSVLPSLLTKPPTPPTHTHTHSFFFD